MNNNNKGTSTVPLNLGTEKIGRLLREYASPAIIAMTASSLYNIVDSIFIGQGVGPMAIAGLAITFPLMNLAAALGAMVGMGASTLISVKFGQKDYKTAQQILGNVLTLNLIIGISFTIISLIFLDPVLYFFGASENTIGYAREYMVIILIGNVISHTYFGLNAILRATGYPSMAMITTIITVVINSILDPIFIFVMHTGIKGAAIATVISQVISLIIQIRHFTNPKQFIHFKKGTYKLNKDIVKNTISIGMPQFLLNATSCVIIILINNTLKKYGGDLAIGAYGIVNKVTFFFLMILLGLTQGMQPIAGYNYGAKKVDRILKLLKTTIIYGTIIMTTAFFFGELMPEKICRAFTSDQELISKSAKGLQIVFTFFPIVGFQIIVSSFFQSIGKAKEAIFLSLTRQVLFLIPLLIIFPMFFGLTGAWVSIPTADLISTITAFILIRREIKKLKNNEIKTF